MSNLLNIGIFLGGYCAISAVTAASIWAIRRDTKRQSPAENLIKLPAKVGKVKVCRRYSKS